MWYKNENNKNTWMDNEINFIFKDSLSDFQKSLERIWSTAQKTFKNSSKNLNISHIKLEICSVQSYLMAKKYK